MFYKYNPFTGRVSPSTQLSAYLPQGMQPEVPVIKLPKKPAPEPARNMTSIPITQKKAAPGLDLGRVPIKPEYQKLQNAQAWFQANEHIDVNVATLRGKFSTYVSIPLCIAVVAFTLYTVTEKAYRK